MKKLLLLLLFISCTKTNPMGTEDPVTVFLYLSRSASATKISCEGQIVSYLQYEGERDTIRVPDGSELKARIYKSGNFVYKLQIATNNLMWELP